MANMSWIFGGIVVAGIVHIVTVFSVPLLAAGDAWTRLSIQTAPNKVLVEAAGSRAILPFTPSDILTAYCLFDLSDNNLVVKFPLNQPSWSLAVSSRSGENFYLVTGADVKKPDNRLLLIRRDRLVEEASTEKTNEGEDQNIVVSPENTGIIAIRAPLGGDSYRERTEEILGKARCDPQKPYEPAVASLSEPPPPEPVLPLRQPPPQTPRTKRR